MVPTAQLKVFAPLGSFPPRERQRWSAYVEAGCDPSPADVAAVEADGAARSLLGGRVDARELAWVRRAGDRVLICPVQLPLRTAHAFAAFRRTVPDVVLDQFVPDGSDVDREPPFGSSPHVIDEPWTVPLHWFVAFAPDERRLDDPGGPVHPQLRYLTTVAQAVWRLERAIEIVEETLVDGDQVLLELAELAAWLSGFVDDAVVELDLAGVAASVPAPLLRGDRTCEELHDALEALDAGDVVGAAARYAGCRARWSQQRARQHAS